MYSLHVSGNRHTGKWWYTIEVNEFPVILSPSAFGSAEEATKAGRSRIRALRRLATVRRSAKEDRDSLYPA